ncbi:hypothetical protein [Streptomyces atroolivaceus]|uniref:hypothetical protein n=1 Tax=Streptomyces atroolivaceus TaxID=66869 RepID=UPI00362606D5
MSPESRGGTPRPAGPDHLWAVSFSALAVFLASWAMCWIQAYAVNDDLPNTCDDVRRQVFPTEVACAAVDGTVTGATPGWLVVLFFASLVVTVLTGTMALAVTAAVRGR